MQEVEFSLEILLASLEVKSLMDGLVQFVLGDSQLLIETFLILVQMLFFALDGYVPNFLLLILAKLIFRYIAFWRSKSSRAAWIAAPH